MHTQATANFQVRRHRQFDCKIGHPYLTQRLCRAILEETATTLPSANSSGSAAPASERMPADRNPTTDLVDRLYSALFLTQSARETEDNLIFVRNRLLKSDVDLSALLDMYSRVKAGRRVPYDETNALCSVLRLSGVCKVRDGALQTGGASAIALSPDGTQVYSGGKDGAIRRWDIASRRPSLLFPPSSSQALHFRLSSSGDTLIAANSDKTVRVWNLRSPRPAASRLISSLQTDPNCFSLSPDGTVLAAAGADVTLWHIPSLKPITTVRTSEHINNAVQFSPNGRLLAIASASGQISLWDTTAYRRLGALSGQTGAVVQMAFSPDGKTLATVAYQDKYIRLWSLNSRQQVGVLSGSGAGAEIEQVRVAFSPDGNMLAVCSAGGSVHIWRAATFAETDRETLPGGARVR